MKRAFDILAATLGLIVFSPIILVTAIMIRWKLGAPVLFQQVRAGRHGEPFTLYKFRTMADANDANGKPLPDAERLPPFGKIIRRSSLDELPQLVNVIKGDMSLVGPRPLFMEYLPHYDHEQARRHDVPPGITGWAQVNGRNALSWPARLALDVWYVDNASFLLDMKIILMTISRVLKRDGVNAEGHTTMPRFDELPKE